MVAELVEWKEEKGTFVVPTSGDGKKLGQWVIEMRNQKREGRLAKDKVDKLDEIGFNWEEVNGKAAGEAITTGVSGESNNRQNQKKRRRNPTRSAKKQQTNDFVGEGFFEDLEVGSGGKGGNHGTASESLANGGGNGEAARKAKKRKVGDQQWEQKFDELVKFKAEHGHFRIPVKEMPLLKYWAQNQKITYRKGKLSDERIAKLQSIGFSWGKKRKGDKGHGDSDEKGSNRKGDRQVVGGKTPSHAKSTSISNRQSEADEASSGDEDEDEEVQETVSVVETSTSSSTASSSTASTATTPTKALQAVKPVTYSPTLHMPYAPANNRAYQPPYSGGPRGVDGLGPGPMAATSAATTTTMAPVAAAVAATGSNMNSTPLADRYLTVREAREYIFSRIEVLERRQEEMHRHMLELRQAFKGMERFMMQHFAREREMTERMRYAQPGGGVWPPQQQQPQPQPQQPHQSAAYGRDGEAHGAAASAGVKGYAGYPGGVMPPSYSYFPHQQPAHASQTELAIERERMASAAYVPQHQPPLVQQHQQPPYAYASYATSAGTMRTGAESPYARHVTSPPPGNSFVRSPTTGPTSSSPSSLSHLNAALGAITQTPTSPHLLSPRTPAAPSPPVVGMPSQVMPHLSPSLGPAGPYNGGVLPHHPHNPYGHIPPHQQRQPLPVAPSHSSSLPLHHPSVPSSSTTASAQPTSHQQSFYQPHRSSPTVIGSPLATGSSTPEAVQTPEAHGLHFPRTPNAPSVTSVTPIPPSIVHQYPPPEEVAPTLSPPRPRMNDFTLTSLNVGFNFLDENEEKGAATVGGGMQSSTAVVGDEDGGATETDENGEELLKELDTFC